MFACRDTAKVFTELVRSTDLIEASRGGLSWGDKVGMAVGIPTGLLCFSFVAWLVYMKRRKRRHLDLDQSSVVSHQDCIPDTHLPLYLEHWSKADSKPKYQSSAPGQRSATSSEAGDQHFRVHDSSHAGAVWKGPGLDGQNGLAVQGRRKE